MNNITGALHTVSGKTSKQNEAQMGKVSVKQSFRKAMCSGGSGMTKVMAHN